MINNLSRYDIYFILILISLLYLFYKDLTKKEGFGQAEDIAAAINTRYNADVEAIRNLSDIATKLTAGGLTVPGNLSVTGTIVTDGDVQLKGTKNQWIIHTPDDDRRSLWIAPGTKDKEYGNWNWPKSLNIDYDGTLNVGGNLNTGGNINTAGTITSNTEIKGKYLTSEGLGAGCWKEWNTLPMGRQWRELYFRKD